MAEEKKLLEIENLRKYFPVNGIKGPGYSENAVLYGV